MHAARFADEDDEKNPIYLQEEAKPKMDLNIELKREDGGPIYRQIAEQIRSMIVDGRLQAGTKLPPIRSFASALGVSKLTVYQAYTQLQESGLVESTVGRGTIVASQLPRAAGTQFLGTLIRTGPIDVFEPVSDSIGVRSLASAVPDPDLFHADEFLAECYALRNESPWVFYYAPFAGASEMLVEACSLMRQRGLPSHEQQIVLTSGCTNARALIMQTLCSAGDAILVDNPGVLMDDEQAKALGVTLVRVPLEEDGPDIEQLAKAAKAFSPKLYITYPTYGPATGGVTSQAKRRAILQLAAERGFLVVEIDSYSRISYDSDPPRPMAAMAEEGVIYVESFSYTLSPGLRLGFIRTTPTIRNRIVKTLRALAVSGVQFEQIALARYIHSGRFDAHLSRVIPKYRARRDALVGSLKFLMPPGVKWTTPLGGFASWVTLPRGGRYETLYQAALDKGVAFTPGALVMSGEEADRHLRLCFGTQSPEAIQQAVHILSRLIEQRLPK